MKKVLFVIGMFIICLNEVYAECDYNKLVTAGTLAKEITYEYKYDYKKKNFNVVFYNVIDNLYLDYANDLHYGNNNNQVTISNIAEGTSMKVYVKAGIPECEPGLFYIYINLPYYNYYKDSEFCKGYDMVTACNSEFLSYENNTKIVQSAIKNYNNMMGIEGIGESEGEKNKVTLIDTITNFFKDYWLKMIIFASSAGITYLIFSIIYRKTKHGL